MNLFFPHIFSSALNNYNSPKHNFLTLLLYYCTIPTTFFDEPNIGKLPKMMRTLLKATAPNAKIMLQLSIATEANADSGHCYQLIPPPVGYDQAQIVDAHVHKLFEIVWHVQI